MNSQQMKMNNIQSQNKNRNKNKNKKLLKKLKLLKNQKITKKKFRKLNNYKQLCLQRRKLDFMKR